MKPSALVLCALVLSGCAAPSTPGPAVAPEDAAVSTPTLFHGGTCSGHNLFLQTTEDVLRPYVPANWTFTTLRSPMAILRIFRAECDDGRALLALSTPMVPDEASLDKHDNPDVVIDVFTNDNATLARWAETGAQAAYAEFTRAPFPGGESLVAVADGGLVLGLDVLATSSAPRPTSAYEWRAVYAAGTEDAIGWFWGDEVVETTHAYQYNVHLGPGTRVDGADTQPYAGGSFWHEFALHYAAGLPPPDEQA